MKTRFTYLCSRIALGLTACDKFLDKMPDNRAEINSQRRSGPCSTSGLSPPTTCFFTEYMSDNVDDLGHEQPRYRPFHRPGLRLG